MTRAWPLRKDDPTEKTDHVHQKSFWFDHGNVNGIDFWADGAPPRPVGMINEYQPADPIATPARDVYSFGVLTHNLTFAEPYIDILLGARDSRTPRAW